MKDVDNSWESWPICCLLYTLPDHLLDDAKPVSWVASRVSEQTKRPIDCLLSLERLLLKEFNDETVTD